MRRTNKVLIASLALLFASGLAVWAQVLIPPPELPKPPKTLERANNDDEGDVTSLKVVLNGVENGPTVPPILTESFASSGGESTGFTGISGSAAFLGGGGASGARASVERNLRRLARDLR